jgi:hypothetical protein
MKKIKQKWWLLSAGILLIGLAVFVSKGRPTLNRPAKNLVFPPLSAQVSVPSSQPIAPPTERNSSPRDIVHSLAAELYQDNQDYHGRDQMLLGEIKKITIEDFLLLAQSLAKNEFSPDEERAFLYILGLSGKKGISSLAEIAASPMPNTRDEAERKRERVVRLDALEKLDILALDSKEAGQALELAAESQLDPALKPFARLAAAGVSRGRPGELHRTLERQLASLGSAK